MAYCLHNNLKSIIIRKIIKGSCLEYRILKGGVKPTTIYKLTRSKYSKINPRSENNEI